MQQHMNSKELNMTVSIACVVLLIDTDPRYLHHRLPGQTFPKFLPMPQSYRAFLTTNSISIHEEWFQSFLQLEGHQFHRPECQAVVHLFSQLLPYILLHSK